MKRLMLIGAALCTLAVMPTLPAAAMRLAPLTPAVTHSDSDTVLAAYRGRGHHYGWDRHRDHHYGWSRGRHLGSR
jgi:hypothetical protein